MFAFTASQHERFKTPHSWSTLGVHEMSIRPHPDFVEAGRIAARVLSEVTKEVKPGAKVLTICTLAEKRILEYGGGRAGIAFPCNVSVNEEAAHYTSPHADTRVLPDRGLVKVDLGAHVNGHISDTAVTVDLDGSFERYVGAAETALEAAIDVIRAGVRLGEVGRVIERAIRREGLIPVHQLSGHQLAPWTLHAGKNVPNVGVRGSEVMKSGETYAVEPFSTDGNGTVRNSDKAFIYANVMSGKQTLDPFIGGVRDIARRRFGTLPWASRWLYEDGIDPVLAIPTLVRTGAIRGYPVLIEGKGGMVAQSEHSLFVTEDGAVVTTLRDNK